MKEEKRTINVVLYEPEIPQNTGNIMRTCMATGAKLHIIEPMGFDLSEKSLRRAGMDYAKTLDYRIYKNYEEFISLNKGQFFFMTRYGHKPPSEFNYSDINDDIYLVFGKESTGIDKSILVDNLDRCFRLPMVPEARSLNLSNCVAICLYEVLRQQGYRGLSFNEEIKGAEWLEEEFGNGKIK